jgi:acetyltransferase-like isoleucine patch superfamily enzyme
VEDFLAPKWFEKVAVLFPLGQAILIFLFLLFTFKQSMVLGIFGLTLAIYVLPLALWKVFSHSYRLEEGVYYIGKKEQGASSWFVAHYLQYLFISFPIFERILILIPGAFSFWLRAWGSQIGKAVIWNPGIQIVDRTHLDIGDHALFGDRVYLSTHIIKRKKGRIQLLVKKISIGKKTLIGYQCNLGPGSVVPDDFVLPSLSQGLLGRIGRSVHEVSSLS